MNNYDFNIGNTKIPIINLTLSGLSFNQPCISALGCPKYITIGLDREGKMLAIKAAEKEDKSICRYLFVTDEKTKKHVTVTALKLRSEISKATETPPRRNGIKYIPEYDSGENMLIINLRQSI